MNVIDYRSNRKFATIGFLSVILGTGFARADVHPVCFNLLCSFEKKYDGQVSNCGATATFVGYVTKDGREGQPNSDFDNHPQLKVQCGDDVLYNGNARLFGDLLGTRIQAVVGPVPAITLDHGALTGGTNSQNGDHVSTAWLEKYGREIDTYRGQCHISSTEIGSCPSNLNE